MRQARTSATRESVNEAPYVAVTGYRLMLRFVTATGEEIERVALRK